MIEWILELLEIIAISVLTGLTLVLAIFTFVGALWGAIAIWRRHRRRERLERDAPPPD